MFERKISLLKSKENTILFVPKDISLWCVETFRNPCLNSSAFIVCLVSHHRGHVKGKCGFTWKIELVKHTSSLLVSGTTEQTSVWERFSTGQLLDSKPSVGILVLCRTSFVLRSSCSRDVEMLRKDKPCLQESGSASGWGAPASRCYCWQLLRVSAKIGEQNTVVLFACG